ncbi:MAG: hypothetical protein AAB309_02750 [Deltaproteobacteria bacterium]
MSGRYLLFAPGLHKGGDMFPSCAGSVAEAHSGKYLPLYYGRGALREISPLIFFFTLFFKAATGTGTYCHPEPAGRRI